MTAAIGDELAEALGPAVGNRAEQVVVAGDTNDYVVLSRGLRFGEADPAVFGVGEAAAGDHVVSGLPGRAQDGVPGSDAAFHPGGLDEHEMAVDVTGGEDVLDVGAQVL